MTPAQKRLIDTIRTYGGNDGGAEYWPVVNDWVRDAGRAKSLALRNINRTVEVLVRSGRIAIDDEGYIHLK